MAIIRIVGQAKVKTVKRQFRDVVGVDIEIYDQEGNPAPDDVTLGSIRKKRPDSTEIQIVGQTLVKNVEAFFFENYGVQIDILAGDGTLADNEITLGAVRRTYGLTDAISEIEGDIENIEDTKMNQDEILHKIVCDFRDDPRNKIIIEAKYLSVFAAEEVGRKITAADLCRAITAYEEGDAESMDEELVDAATALCHQVADRCWGECIDEDNDEWEEIDITTEWSDFNCEDPDELFVTVYQD